MDDTRIERYKRTPAPMLVKESTAPAVDVADGEAADAPLPPKPRATDNDNATPTAPVEWAQ